MTTIEVRLKTSQYCSSGLNMVFRLYKREAPYTLLRSLHVQPWFAVSATSGYTTTGACSTYAPILSPAIRAGSAKCRGK